ncbi:MAG: hypothetical protein ACRD9S_08935 [Pyrinomonadaceae bacterium]
MNTNDDYLWDKTGEPDPEIQQLEEILGTLRYQPRPLEIPAGLQVGRERSFFRGFAAPLAIAAAIATLLLGLGLWLGLQRLQRSPQQIVKTPDAPQVEPKHAAVSPPNEKQNSSVVATSPQSEKKRVAEPRRHQPNRSLLARNSNRTRKPGVADQQLTLKQQQEAQAAKDQLMLALRLTSAKLNLAQKKAQSTSTRDLIHNQHKIG